MHYEGLGLPNYFPDKIFIHLRSTSKLELRKAYAEDRASEKLKCPSQAMPGDTPGCGKPAKVVGTTPFGKPLGGTRVMTEPNGNNPSTMWQSAGLPATCVIWKDMLGSQRLNGCRSAVMDDQSGAGLRYSPAAPESAWVY